MSIHDVDINSFISKLFHFVLIAFSSCHDQEVSLIGKELITKTDFHNVCVFSLFLMVSVKRYAPLL